MTETKTYTCDICKEEGKKKDLVQVSLEQSYLNKEYHAHPACLDKVGLQWSQMPLVPVPEDKTWLFGKDAIVLTCPKCDLAFSKPDDKDPQDCECPGCGFKYVDEPDGPTEHPDD